MLNSPEKHGDARGLMRLEVEPLNPLILGIIERGGFDTETLRKLESVVVRILFWFDRPSAKLSQLNFKSCNVLQEQSPAWEEELTKLWKNDFEITNQEFMEKLRTKRLYGPGVTRRRLLYLMEEIENTRHRVGSFSFVKNCTIEHVIPQTLSDAWIEELRLRPPRYTRQNVETLHEVWVHTLGNLTVLIGADQPLSSNFPFEKKAEIYHEMEGAKQTYLNSYFDAHRSWGFNKVETRGKQLAQVANIRWPKL